MNPTRGKSLKEVAGEHRLSLHTVQVQLKAIFQKTDTHRQAELLRLVWTGPFGIERPGERNLHG